MEPIVVSNVRLHEDALNLLRGVARVRVPEGARFAGRDWILDNVEGARVIIAGFARVDGEVLDRAGRGLELVIARSSGVDYIDLEAAAEHGVCVANQPEAIAFAVAEHALGLALSQSKRLLEGHQLLVSGGWRGFPGQLRGRLIGWSTVGVVGLGRIGALLAYYARLLGAPRVLYWSRRRKPELEQLLGLEPASLERLFEESNIVFLVLPDTPETRGLVGYDLLRRLPADSVLVNVGRGRVLDEEALLRILRERRDVRIALDVYKEEPLPSGHPIISYGREGRATLTPHFGGYSLESMYYTDLLAARQARHYLETGTVWNPVAGPCRQARDIPRLWDWRGRPPPVAP